MNHSKVIVRSKLANKAMEYFYVVFEDSKPLYEKQTRSIQKIFLSLLKEEFCILIKIAFT